MKVKQTYLQRAFQMTLWSQMDMGYNIFPVMPKVLGVLTRSQGQFVSAKREQFELARTRREPYCILHHEACVIEFQRYGDFEHIKVRWLDHPPSCIWMGWFIYAAWGSLEDVTYIIRKWMMTFKRRFTRPQWEPVG